MAKTYEKYLSVDSDFIPVFSENSDREYPNKWKSFFAHDSFKSIISNLVETLEKGNKDKDQPIWMHGAYGTGKTYASFVIKHLLEDDLSEVKAYCDANEMSSLYGRIAGARNKGKIIVAHRSSSAGVRGNDRLYNCIMESVKNALKLEGYVYLGSKSQYDRILGILKDPNASFGFDKAFDKYRIKFEGYENAQSVVRDLEELGVEDSTDLLESIVEVAEEEHFNFSTEHTEVINWLEDVIKGNNLYAIVFIWDEFTEFFKNNQNNITGLQEIAMAASRINFYPFIITHSGPQIIADQSAKKIIEARFKIKSIDMAETTAFKLMGQAIKVDADLSDEWNKAADGLWETVRKTAKEKIINNSKETTEAELKKLLPIHPYATFLLKIIAKEISSNQRTMFQFLSGDYVDGQGNKHNFKWFIDTHNTEFNEWNFLTSDYIWDYFFTDENVDLSDSFKSAIAQFENFKHICEQDENKARVLKVALLLSAIQQKNMPSRAQGQSVLLKASLSNISLAFAGTPIASMVSNTMAIFSAKGVFSTIQDGNDTLYVPPVNNIDQERFDGIVNELKTQLKFEKIITDGGCDIIERFKLDGYLQYRIEIYPVCVKNYKECADSAKELPAHQIPAFYFFAVNEGDQTKVNEAMKNIKEIINRDYVIVDFSSSPFSDNEFEKYIHSKAEEKYYKQGTNQAKLAKQNADKIIRDWKTKLTVTNIYLKTNKTNDVKNIQGSGNLVKFFKEFNHSVYGAGLEEITINDKIFSPQGFKDKVALMAMNKEEISPNYSYLRTISKALENDKIWNNPNYVSEYPNHAVSLLKKSIDTLIIESFDKNSMVAITDIWDVVQQPPFGLMCCTGAVFLLGFLLKEYGDGTYYRNDGINTVSLNYNDLAELIFITIKGNNKARNQYIVKQKPEHVEFCKITGEIFKISKDKQNSIQDIVKNISNFLKDNDFPLWSLKSYIMIEFEGNDLYDSLIKSIDLFCEIVSSRNMAGRDTTTIAEELYALYKKNAGLDSVLADVVCLENMKDGMSYYIAGYKPDLISIIKRLGVSNNDLLIELNRKLSSDASYLWDVGDTTHQIDNLYIDYCLINSINAILPEKKKSLSESANAISKKLELIKIPRTLVLEENPGFSELFNILDQIKLGRIDDKAKAENTINEHTVAFNDFFVNQRSVMELLIKNRMNSVSQNEFDYLYGQVTDSAFTMQADSFILELNNKLIKFRKDQKINQLHSLWEKETNTKNPREWALNNKISILCAFENDINSARFSFEFINAMRNPRNEDEVDSAICFIKNSFTKIKEVESCAIDMRNSFCGEYAYIINDIQDFQDYLSKELGDNAYSWYDMREQVKKSVEEYVKRIYSSHYVNKVVEKIKVLSPEDAKKYLIDLIKDKPLVGINILKK